MPKREVDARKTRKALRKLERARKTAEAEGHELSDWETEFADSVEKRLKTYGSAFRDAAKGRLEEPLSARQAQKLTEIGRKAAGKGGGLKRSGPIRAKRPDGDGARPKAKSKLKSGLKSGPKSGPKSTRGPKS